MATTSVPGFTLGSGLTNVIPALKVLLQYSTIFFIFENVLSEGISTSFARSYTLPAMSGRVILRHILALL